MTRQIEWGDECIAVLVETPTGNYIAPPIVFDTDGDLVMGQELLAAVVASDTTIQHPVLHNCGPVALAVLEWKLAFVAEQLGVPLGPASQ